MTDFLTTDWDMDAADTPFRSRMARLGRRAGSRDLGASVFELEPGGAASPYHLHRANEELLFVISGTPSVRTPEGTRRLAPGDVMAFLPGEDGAHRVFNASDAPARVVLVSTMRYPEIAEHVDTGTVLAMNGPGDGRFYPAGTEGEMMPLMLEALERATELEAAQN